MTTVLPLHLPSAIAKTTQNIHNLWSGRVDSNDGALQLLLIIDYIFDWARDLYRPGIYRQLQSLATDDFSESRSIATDSDIYSLRASRNRLLRSRPDHVSNLDGPVQESTIHELHVDNDVF